MCKTDLSQYDLSSLKSIVTGAAPLGPELEAEFAEKFPGIVLKQAWGMTELSPLGTFTPDRLIKEGSIGPLIPNTVGKVIDVENGEILKAGEVGEFCLKGPQMMLGYLNNEEATKSTIIDGWLHTGDLVFADEDGYFTVTDRLKELIKYKGFQVAPAELEGVILGHENVADVAVIGVNDGEGGELPKAFVVSKDPSRSSEEEIKEFVKAKLVHYKQLRGGVEFVDSIPKTASGKILRRQLK